MKILLVILTLVIFFSMLLGSARRSGKLNEQANKAVGSLANTLRYLVYGIVTMVMIVIAVVVYHEFWK